MLIMTATMLVFTGCGKRNETSSGDNDSIGSKIGNIFGSSKRMAQSQMDSVGGMLGFSKSMDRAQKASINDLKQIGLALMMYAQDNREKFPSPVARQSYNTSAPSKYSSIDVLYGFEYLSDADAYIAEFDKQSVKASFGNFDPAKNSSYAYIGYNIIAGNYGDGFPIVFEKPWLLPENWDKIAVCFADGSVRIVTIPGVSKMSCRQVVEYLLRNESHGKEQFLRGADIADQIH